MMWWYGNDMGGWGFVLMTVSMVSFWALIIFGAIALVRYLDPPGRFAPPRPTAEQVLAERFAGGEIDVAEYRERVDVLRDGARSRAKP